MSLNKVLEVARKDLGYTEAPAGSNNTKYGAVYGLQGQPWCAIFLWWIFREAGESAAFFGGAKTASCGTLLRWYKAQGQTVPVEQVQPGDIVILNFSGKKVNGELDTEHCGLVVNVPASGLTNDPDFYTIEGNTSSGVWGSQDNGGCVAEKLRHPHQIVGVCRPKYKATPPVPSGQPPREGAGTGDDVTGHWAEKEIRRCMDKGLMRGYEDGSFQPDRPVTRAELATVLTRLEEIK